MLHLQGIHAVLDPEIQKTLGITKSQKEAIENAQEENRSQFTFTGGEMPDRDEVMKQAQKNKKNLEAALEKIVTADQKAALKKLAGPPFKKDAN
jgi:hypothetical protein